MPIYTFAQDSSKVGLPDNVPHGLLFPKEDPLPSSGEKAQKVAIPIISESGLERIAQRSEKWFQIAWKKICEAFLWLADMMTALFKRLFGIVEDSEKPLTSNTCPQNPIDAIQSFEVQEEFEKKEEIAKPSNKLEDIEIEIPLPDNSKSKVLVNPPLSVPQNAEPLDKVIYLGGIPNIGNSCYMNSCLQAVVGTELRSFIDKELPKLVRPEIKIGEAEIDYRKKLNFYFNEMVDWKRNEEVRKKIGEFKVTYDAWDNESERRKRLVLSATDLRKKTFESGICPTFEISSLFQQKDAPEFMLGLMTALGVQFNLSIKTTSIDEPADFSIDTQHLRTLDIQLGNTPTTFQKLIDNFGAKEVVNDENNKWKFSQAKSYKHYSREIKISGQIPEFLVIQLKRMEWSKLLNFRIKLATKISWDSETVDLACIIDPDLYSKGQSTKYTPLAYVTHNGVAQFGHYTANVLNASNWFRLDDEKLPEFREYQDEKLDREDGYLFILKRV